MYMDQAKRKLALLMGFKDSQELCNTLGITKVSLVNIFYRNRGEDKVELLFLPKVLMDSKDELGSKVAEFIRNHVPNKKMVYPILDVWDMREVAEEIVRQKSDFLFENDSWLVAIEREKVPQRQADGYVVYEKTEQEKWGMRIYPKAKNK